MPCGNEVEGGGDGGVVSETTIKHTSSAIWKSLGSISSVKRSSSIIL